jgi:hypothetical protein
MGKPHVPLEVDVAAFVQRYLDEGGDPGEVLVAIGRAFPGVSYGLAGRAIEMANRRRAAQ